MPLRHILVVVAFLSSTLVGSRSKDGEGKTPRPRPLSELMDKADPLVDDHWSSEALSDRVSQVLALLDPLIANAGEGEMPPSMAAGKATDLRPELVRVHASPGFGIFRPVDAGVPGGKPIVDFTAAFRAAMAPLREVEGEIRSKFKIVRVERKAEGATTRILFEASRGPLQMNAVWSAAWKPASDPSEDLPRLDTMRLVDYEEIRAATADLFADATEAVLGRSEAFHRQLAYGAPYWQAKLDVAFGVNQANHGLAIGDANGDGLEDLYLAQPDGLPNRLYVRDPDGTLVERSAEAGLDLLDVSRTPLFVDLDNDGDQDFLLTHRSSLSVYRNDGGLTFVKMATHDLGSRTSGIAAADYDNDGDLDFYVCGYSPMSQTSPEDIFSNPVPYHDALNGAFNHLFRNEGSMRFVDATEGSGFDVANTRFSFTATWADYDADGDMDLYVANDFGRNNLFQNQLSQAGKPVFTDVADQFGVEDIGAGMSVDWGDPDNDGNLDLYVANMWSSAGGRIAHQEQFKADADSEIRGMLQRHARGNSLFLQKGRATFEDVSIPSAVEMGRWAWGSLFIDFDNDGWEDIYTTNGFMTAPDKGDL